MKKYLFAVISFVLGIGCLIAYNIIGSEVTPDGALREPFYLIPLGYLFVAIGIMIGIAVSASLFHIRKKTT